MTMSEAGTRSRRRFAGLVDRLKQAGLRPTRQRLALARLLFEGDDRHVCAESLFEEARATNIRVSLATVYNSLNQFTGAGLLREIIVAPGRSYFDTKVSNHHHFYVEQEGTLVDIPEDHVSLNQLPTPPQGTAISRVDIVVRVSSEK